MSCGLSVLGENFDVDAFVSKVSTLGFMVAYKGDPINKVNQKNEHIPLRLLQRARLVLTMYQGRSMKQLRF